MEHFPEEGTHFGTLGAVRITLRKPLLEALMLIPPGANINFLGATLTSV